jgi:hypothetical protein
MARDGTSNDASGRGMASRAYPRPPKRRGRPPDLDRQLAVRTALWLRNLMGNKRGAPKKVAKFIAETHGFEIYDEMRKHRRHEIPREYVNSLLRQKLDRFLVNNPPESFTPEMQRLFLLLQKIMSIIDAYESARGVSDHALSNLSRNAQGAEAGTHGAPYVVQGPTVARRALLDVIEPTDGAATVGENEAI